MTFIFILLQTLLLQENEQAIVYYLPKTEIAITVEYDMTVNTAGPLAAFAEEMLGIREVVSTSDTIYTIDKVTTGTRTTADNSRCYKIVPQAGLETQLLSIDHKGILRGYNIAGEEENEPTHEPKIGLPHKAKVRRSAPLNEEALQAADDRERARAVAKQISQIREARTYLLLGESEHQPADGRAMDVLLKAMNEEEEALVALFIGEQTTTHMKKTLHYLPTESTQVILARFSREKGIVDRKDYGLPITLTISQIERQKVEAVAADAKPDKKAPKPSAICYNLPGKATYQLHIGEEQKAERTISVAQFGVAIPLTENLLRTGNTTHIHFNTRTGNIESIER